MMRGMETMKDRARFIRDNLENSPFPEAERDRLVKGVQQGADRTVRKFLAENYEKGLTFRIGPNGLEASDPGAGITVIVNLNALYNEVETASLLKENE